MCPPLLAFRAERKLRPYITVSDAPPALLGLTTSAKWDGPAASPAGVVCKDYTATPGEAAMDTSTSPLSSIGIDIGKEVFHIVGFSTNGIRPCVHRALSFS
jgi:hypothetical protein